MLWLIGLAALVFVATTLRAIVALRRAPRSDPWRWRVLVWPQLAFVLLVLALAYDGSFASGRQAQLLSHGGDKLGHLVLFGLLALGTHFATRGRTLDLERVRLRLPLAILLPMSFAAAEEALQALSPHRTADPVDLLCDLVGMVLFWRLGVRITRQSSGPSTDPAARRTR